MRNPAPNAVTRAASGRFWTWSSNSSEMVWTCSLALCAISDSWPFKPAAPRRDDFAGLRGIAWSLQSRAHCLATSVVKAEIAQDEQDHHDDADNVENSIHGLLLLKGPQACRRG